MKGGGEESEYSRRLEENRETAGSILVSTHYIVTTSTQSGTSWHQYSLIHLACVCVCVFAWCVCVRVCVRERTMRCPR